MGDGSRLELHGRTSEQQVLPTHFILLSGYIILILMEKANRWCLLKDFKHGGFIFSFIHIYRIQAEHSHSIYVELHARWLL